MQALKQLGLDDTRLVALDDTLRGHGTNAQARLSEEARRAERLDETFDLLRAHIKPGDEFETYITVQQIRDNLDAEALDAFDVAVGNARRVYQELEPVIGREDASNLAVEMLDSARSASDVVRRKLWAKDLIGTEHVNTSEFGDWAVRVLSEIGRNAPATPGLSMFYKLAGRNRLREELKIGEDGRPLRDTDLEGVKGGDGFTLPLQKEPLLTAEEIPSNGLYDLFGGNSLCSQSKNRNPPKFS